MRQYNLKADVQDVRDVIFDSLNIFRQLPKSADLRSGMSPVVDQGELGSCTANAIASGLREYLELKSGKPLVRLSRLFLYWHEREIEGTVDVDSGASLRDGMKVLSTIGVSPESDYPYVVSNFTDKPTSQAEADAAAYKISAYHRVISLNQLKASIADGYPVVMGIEVYESFESQEVAVTGVIPLPDPSKEQLLGGHAVLAVGYDDTQSQVIVRNSWGASWGDKGYCYMPYAYFNNYVSDMWTGR